MKRSANNELSLPQSNKPGTKINSSVFIVPIIIICVMAQNLFLNPLKIQIAITISESPINVVRSREWSLPNIRETICSCLGTRFRTLQTSPLINQTIEMKYNKILWMCPLAILGQIFFTLSASA